IILEPQVDNGAEITTEAINQAIEVIRQRVDSSGVAEAEITSQGGQNIVVALPGQPDEATLDLVRQSAQMRFRVLLVEDAPNPVDPAMLNAQDPTAGATEEPTDAATELPTEEPTEDATDGAEGTTDGAGMVGSSPNGGASMMRPTQ